MLPGSLRQTLETPLRLRASMIDTPFRGALRLFNGFIEGCPGLVVELYADTLVLMNHANPPDTLSTDEIDAIVDFYQSQVPDLQCAIVKNRYARDRTLQRGKIIWGSRPAQKIMEHGVWYALDLRLHQDTSIYLDTRNLREWAIRNLAEKYVLNTFAYTGSLGVAATAGGAAQVIHVDLNRQYLNIAKTSYTLNGFLINKKHFRASDFYTSVSTLKRAGAQFDCVILDPPFFSVTSRGHVDQVSESAQLINKVRPLVADNGWLVTVNNALFVSGVDHLRTLEALCADGYLSIEEIIPVPDDCAGYPQTRLRPLPCDPAPYNHATKMTILRVKRKI